LSDEGIDLGAITLGERIGGDGHYGFVYAIVGRPGLALKLIYRERSGPPSIARQVAGYRLLEPCMGLCLSRSFGTPAHLYPSSVSLFRSESRFFVPTRASPMSSRAEAVKSWPSHQPNRMLRPCQAIP
jgi:hypothetical protein